MKDKREWIFLLSLGAASVALYALMRTYGLLGMIEATVDTLIEIGVLFMLGVCSAMVVMWLAVKVPVWLFGDATPVGRKQRLGTLRRWPFDP